MQVLRKILRQSAKLAFIAIIVGLVLSVAVRSALLVSMGRSAGSGALSGFDPRLFVAVTLLLVDTARRASRIDPQQALRQE